MEGKNMFKFLLLAFFPIVTNAQDILLAKAKYDAAMLEYTMSIILLGLALVLAIGLIIYQAKNQKKCDKCKSIIPKDATKCAKCGSDV